MRYVYVVSEMERYISIIDLKSKTVTGLCQYDDGDLDYGQALTWNEKDSNDFLEYSTIEDILNAFDSEKDMIFISEFTMSEMYLKIHNSNYSNWEKNWEPCFNLLKQIHKSCLNIGIEELALMMQQ